MKLTLGEGECQQCHKVFFRSVNDLCNQMFHGVWCLKFYYFILAFYFIWLWFCFEVSININAMPVQYWLTYLIWSQVLQTNYNKLKNNNYGNNTNTPLTKSNNNIRFKINCDDKFDLPVLQFFPINPGWQMHVSGATHLPPFLHPPLHFAIRKIS